MSSFKLIALFAVVVVLALAEAYPRLVVIDDEYVPAIRVRRQAPDQYQPAASEPSYGGSSNYGKGKVGPVYTFVKTDPKANFKWGVRHRAGSQYAG